MKKFSQLALPYIIWSIIILLLPVLLIAFYAVTDSGNAVVNFNFTLQNFVKFFTDPDFLLILWRSLSIASNVDQYACKNICLDWYFI